MPRPIIQPSSVQRSSYPPARKWVANRSDRALEVIVTAVAFTGIAAILLIFVFTAKEALPLLLDAHRRSEVGFQKLFLPQVLRPGRPAFFMWQPVGDVPKLSMIPLFVGTLKVTLIAMSFAAPLGIGAALFTAEFAPARLREVLKPTLELLAGIPSVVLGFFALMVLASWLQRSLGLTYRLNGLCAGVALGLSIAPIIFTVCEDALATVPQSYRQASLALGATRWETAWKVALPAAAPGVLAACVLGFGRAIGETMIVLMASGNAAVVSWHPAASVRTLSATIAAEMGEVAVGSAHYSILFFIGVELFVFTFLLNTAAAVLTRRFLLRSSGAPS